MKRSKFLLSTCLSLFAVGTLLIASPLPALADANADLVTAAARGDTAKVVQLLSKGADVNVRDAGGYTPLIWAALNGHDAVIGELLRRGADVKARDKESYTALMWAAQNHRADAVRALLAHGANPNEVDREGYTALTWAAQDGQPDIAIDLILAHADVNARDRAGYTALMWAAQQGHNSVVKAVMMNGANPSLRDYKGFTALDLAIAFNRYDVKEYLMHVAPQSLTMAPATRATYYGGPQPRTRGRARPGFVAMVGTPDTGWAPNNASTQSGYYVNGSWVGQQATAPAWTNPATMSVDARVATFDVNGDHVVDGRDWRALTPARRTELSNILHGVRCNAAFCTPGHPASVMSKLDWVYSDATRLPLTLNMAYDFPMPNAAKPTSW